MKDVKRLFLSQMLYVHLNSDSQQEEPILKEPGTAQTLEHLQRGLLEQRLIRLWENQQTQMFCSRHWHRPFTSCGDITDSDTYRAERAP